MRMLERIMADISKTTRQSTALKTGLVTDKEKDSPVTLILKLSQMLLKWHEAEQKYAQSSQEISEEIIISDTDIDVIEAYLNRKK